MRRGAVTLLRADAVLLYALAAWYMRRDGTSAAEIVTLLLVGAVLFVLIVLADWVNSARRREW